MRYTATVTATVVTTYTYDLANRLETAKSDDSTTTWYYVYDNNGRRLQQLPGSLTPAAGAVQYSYDQSGRLVQVDSHDGTAFQLQAEMVYDGRGNRLKAIAYANGTAITATYTLDPRSGLPLVVDNGTSSTRILYGQAAIGEYSSEWRYYLGDAQLSVRQLVDESGSVTQAQTYAPFGILLHQAGDGGGLFGYKGGQSSANGLWYFGNGYFDPNTGQFISQSGDTTSPLATANAVGFFLVPVLFIGWRWRKGKKSIHPATMLFLGIMFIATLSSCNAPNPTPATETPEAPIIPPTGAGTDDATPESTQPPPTVIVITPEAPQSTNEPTPTIIPPDPTCTPESPMPTPDPQPALGSWDILVLFTDPIATATPTPTGDEAENYNWKESEKDVVREAAKRVAKKLADTIKNAHPTWDVDQFPNKAFLMVYGGPVTFNKTGQTCQQATNNDGCWGQTQGRNMIHVYTDADIRDSTSKSSEHWAVHELGHAFINAVGTDPIDTLDTAINDKDSDNYNPRLGRPTVAGELWGFADKFPEWQNSESNWTSEVFADMYTGWVYNSWETDENQADGLADDGRNRKNFMDTYMPDWIEDAIENAN